ncbi:MAG: entericidin A/B family lipoprotein [Rhodobacteraceae bacterium]|nr:entericidin A/B family lipoprotein [Paracoccaceae bacterium]
MRPAFLAILAVLSLAACNTVEGMGQDLSAAGDAMTSTAGDVKHKM